MVLVVATSAAQQARSVQRRPKNVLVIVLDDLGTDKLGFYGETPPTCPPGTCELPPNCSAPQTGCVGPYPATPNLDALREQGILFTRAYATPLCSPTRAYIQTGRFGFRTGVGNLTNTVQLPGDFELSSDEKFLAELVREGVTPSGPGLGLPYRCGAFGKWHMSTTLPSDYGHAVENGFHRFYGTMGNLGNHFRYTKVAHDEGDAPEALKIDGRNTVPPFETDTWHASVTSRDALEWIDAQSNAFLAYVAYSAPHAPLQVPPASLLSAETLCELACADLEPGDFMSPSSDPPEQLRLVHRAMSEAVDAEIGKLVGGMRKAQRDNTMIFVIGDNGTAAYVVDDPPHDADHAKAEVYELGIRVPLIVSGPLVKGPIPGGGWESDALISAVDLWRTIADITGANVAQVVPQGHLDSISFLPVIRDPLAPGNRLYNFSQQFLPNGELRVPAPSCYSMNERGVSDGVYKYIRVQTGVAGTPCGTPVYSEELYHLASDPEELFELITTGLDPSADAALTMLRAVMNTISGM